MLITYPPALTQKIEQKKFSDFFRHMENAETGQSLQRQPTMIQMRQSFVDKVLNSMDNEDEEEDEDEVTEKSDNELDTDSVQLPLVVVFLREYVFTNVAATAGFGDRNHHNAKNDQQDQSYVVSSSRDDEEENDQKNVSVVEKNDKVQSNVTTANRQSKKISKQLSKSNTQINSQSSSASGWGYSEYPFSAFDVGPFGGNTAIKLSNGTQDQDKESEDGKTSVKQKRDQPHVLAEDDDDDDDDGDDNDDDDDDLRDEKSQEESKTKDFDLTLWLEPKEGTFEECDIRLEDEELEHKKPEAERFLDPHFFFDSFTNASTTMDSYDEWKKKRKVLGFRTTALKDIDHALKAYILCVDTMKAMMRNCLLIFYDIHQDMHTGIMNHSFFFFLRKQTCSYVEFKETKNPSLPGSTFNCGPYSVVAAWDLFKFGATLTNEDWKHLLDEKSPAQFFTRQNPDTRHFTDPNERKRTEAYNTSRRYVNFCLAEHFNKYLKSLGFGSCIEWKKVKSQFLNKSNAAVLNAFDSYSYYINPKFCVCLCSSFFLFYNLANLMDDRNAMYISNRKILAEPMLWLIYVYRFLLDKQTKLSKLCLYCSNFGLETRAIAKKIQDIVSDLGKSAKEESDDLQKLMTKIPLINDLKETFKKDIAQRDLEKSFFYFCIALFSFVYTTTIQFLLVTWGDGDITAFLDTKKKGLNKVKVSKIVNALSLVVVDIFFPFFKHFFVLESSAMHWKHFLDLKYCDFQSHVTFSICSDGKAIRKQ
ncbi:hypothetical protein RFI_33187 [Reticulomyxa filosa]|uniref:Uncharacterized protein n=1 Tax=Reticulomyxa filosa TaxID=46433 RepID=X6LSW9_RETFI|nr:hypothetical protein RFI_33187 [Reticulomyxa filosa]|eukprot:ETO04212.1 hypothetical protein RFI_33187 [Reticulomyxa filosa]